ncbi:murein L,D-transpeptidase [Neisseria sp. CCUG17229]|nr:MULTISPECIES: murein L,D-transpeptidase [Neisseria]
MKRKKVIVDTAKAELCFADDKQCHPVLIGKTTPKGTFPMTIMATKKSGYGGEVIGFKEERDFLFALHRVWLGKPSERRMERIASPLVADRVMTNGCINVTDNVYEKLRHYFTLEVI